MPTRPAEEFLAKWNLPQIKPAENIPLKLNAVSVSPSGVLNLKFNRPVMLNPEFYKKI